MNHSKDLQLCIQSLPDQPGVYLFYDQKDEIIYIGKARNLKKRVSSYFTKQKFESQKIKVLVSRIQRIEHIVVPSEADALLLENNLIKEHQPRYNIMLKDDKTFPWICIKNELFPRVFSTRTVVRDGSQYFGPYTSAYAVKILLTLIRQLYPLRNCKYALTEENISRKKFKRCLEYHIGNCLGPCEGLQSREQYDESIKQIREIIRGNLSEVISFLNREMKRYADSFQFEAAQQFKEKIEILSRHQSKSTIVNPSIHDVDVFSIVSEEKEAYVNFLKVVKGAVIQAHTVEIKKKLDEADRDLLAFAVTDLRNRIESSAREIILPLDLRSCFPENRIIVPRRGDKKKLLELSERNARSYRIEKRKKEQSLKSQTHTDRILTTLKSDLRLKELPLHIECFDNSNLQGDQPVAACVVFKNGKPAKKEYRHYNIKSVSGIDDYASMGEVVFRRYSRVLKEKSELPQLIIIDGGKGQLNAALQSLVNLDLRGRIAVVGVAKKLEEIYFPEDPVPLYIDKNSESLKLIQGIRNEAHRFGINFHRQKRTGNMIQSVLEEVPGIGTRTIEKLFTAFKSLEGIRSASETNLAEVIGKEKSRILMQHLRDST